MTIDELKRLADAFVVVADENGVITWCNDGLVDVHGWRAQDLVGEPITTLMPARYHDAHNLGFSRFLATHRPSLLGRSLQLKMSLADGREVDAEHFILAERDGQRWVFAAAIRLPRDGERGSG